MLTLKNIKKIYEQSDEAVLDDINLNNLDFPFIATYVMNRPNIKYIDP